MAKELKIPNIAATLPARGSDANDYLSQLDNATADKSSKPLFIAAQTIGKIWQTLELDNPFTAPEISMPSNNKENFAIIVGNFAKILLKANASVNEKVIAQQFVEGGMVAGLSGGNRIKASTVLQKSQGRIDRAIEQARGEVKRGFDVMQEAINEMDITDPKLEEAADIISQGQKEIKDAIRAARPARKK